MAQTIDRADGKLALTHIIFALAALMIGGIAGMLQGMVRGGVIELPGGIGYYQLLTAHGVLMALVFTTFFIIGFMFSGLSKVTGGKLTGTARGLGWLGFWLMAVGTAIGTVMILLNKATVLYTFYAPLKASPWFYVALALVVVGSWLSGAGMIAQYVSWRKNNKGKISPLFAFMAVATMGLWYIATLGVAITVLFQFIPWSFGWVEKINVMLSRTLFWYFGHPLVYFWLMPVYICWYVIVPKVIGGKIFSDALARLAFVLLLLFSTPVGFHHQLMEPGITPFWKFLQVILTFMVVVPSLITAFALFATFETTGRAKGYKGLFGWFKALPWKDVRFLAPFMGMVAFIPGGIGGMINASHQMNALVHNTIWVTGHFHLTVATAVAITFFGIAYWLIPAITGRRMTEAINRLGILQVSLWALGILVMSGAMHISGLLGAPRRTSDTTYNGNEIAAQWDPYNMLMAIGGVILFISLIVMAVALIKMIRLPKGETEYPVAESLTPAEATPRWLERWGVWVGLAAVLIVVAYAIPITDMIANPAPGAKGFVLW
mgnify:FL=1